MLQARAQQVLFNYNENLQAFTISSPNTISSCTYNADTGAEQYIYWRAYLLRY